MMDISLFLENVLFMCVVLLFLSAMIVGMMYVTTDDKVMKKQFLRMLAVIGVVIVIAVISTL